MLAGHLRKRLFVGAPNDNIINNEHYKLCLFHPYLKGIYGNALVHGMEAWAYHGHKSLDVLFQINGMEAWKGNIIEYQWKTSGGQKWLEENPQPDGDVRPT